MTVTENFWKQAKNLAIMMIIFLVIVSIKQLKSIEYVGTNSQNVSSITVDGTGEMVSVPDIATFSFTVTETAKTVAEAQAQATTKVNAAIKAVRDGGVADKDIQTISYNINPHYDYQTFACTSVSCPPSKSVLTGYDVSQSEQIKVRDLTKAGALFTAVGSLSVQNVNNLSFAIEHPEDIQAQARAKAIDNAKSKAQILAKQLGVSLVRITNFSESNNYPRPMVYSMALDKNMATGAAAAVAPEVSTGEQKVTENVSVTYEIK